ncbi:MAG: hypothetical protein FWF18_04880 [Dehalococcoidia bacterium]|nr:hypothetical protein [Dehalococcoidia bacterium]
MVSRFCVYKAAISRKSIEKQSLREFENQRSHYDLRHIAAKTLCYPKRAAVTMLSEDVAGVGT